MIDKNDIIQLSVSEKEIKESIREALVANFNERDNLRGRDSNVQFDCLLRGYIGEKAILKWFNSFGVYFKETNYMNDNGNIDIDLLYEYGENNQKTLEIKTSLIPDNFVKNIPKTNIIDKIDKCIEIFDIKLIRRYNENIEDLKGDIHIQIYFGDLRKQKDDFLKEVSINTIIKNEKIDFAFEHLVDEIYNKIFAKLYKTRTFLVGWIDKETLIKQNKNKNVKEKIWSFQGSKREFWTCKIKNEAKAPSELIDYLKKLK